MDINTPLKNAIIDIIMFITYSSSILKSLLYINPITTIGIIIIAVTTISESINSNKASTNNMSYLPPH